MAKTHINKRVLEVCNDFGESKGVLGLKSLRITRKEKGDINIYIII